MQQLFEPSRSLTPQPVTETHDLIAIGSGPPAGVAAVEGARFGERVALVERDESSPCRFASLTLASRSADGRTCTLPGPSDLFLRSDLCRPLRWSSNGRKTMNLSGIAVRNESVLLLASMFGGDELAEKLERAVCNANSIVALSVDDRERIVAVLRADAPSGLTELRDVLAVQLKRYKDREAQQQRMRLNGERALARGRKQVARKQAERA